MTGATTTPEHNGNLVDSLGSALRSGEHGLSTVPGLLKRVLVEQSWMDFVTKRGEHVQHACFADFVTTPPLKGLGTTVELVRRVVADDVETLDLLDRAMQRQHGGDHKSEDFKTHNVQLGSGNNGGRQDKALRKLRADAPELHTEVLAGNLSAHAAMVQAGFRPKTFTVRAEPTSAARALRKNFTSDEITELRELLSDQTGGC